VAAFISGTTPNGTTDLNPSPDNPVEVGDVHWLRDVEAGRNQAKATGKPLLILFQEVPGCSNCTRFGSGPLRHALIVEAIESHFIPVCIYNNKGGKDKEALLLFNEPAWNNPVVRIVDAANRDLVPRMPNFGSPSALVAAMTTAIAQQEGNVPEYLKLLQEELVARESGLQTATFSMYCFWSGEGTLGAVPGVIETAPGFQDGREVVRVQFNPAVVQKSELESVARPKGITTCTRNEGFRNDREPKYYLSQTNYRFLPMTSVQACRANSMIGSGQSPDALFSPKQRLLLAKIAAEPGKKWKNRVDDNLIVAGY
jgi:hypothetical protein